ncbi:uncharacterized protein LOC119650916 [Hermetia illucens]|uniref:uncharacterized protein LOC119650916 n=1 Tax=Hermetia illucens TaxID=343691 RepID=UPI0018CC10D7|nr:uncharacterized protein LOC119650916 [Hermetia illucens]
MEAILEKINNLTQQQDVTGQEIQRLLSNYRKDSVARKTREYLTTRLEQLENLWTAFSERNEELEELAHYLPAHPYFEKQYFSSMQREYTKYKEDIAERLQGLEGTSKLNIDLGKSATGALDTKAATAANNAQNELPSDVVVLIRQQQSRIRAVENIISGIDTVEQAQPKSYYELKTATLSKYWEELRQGHQNIWQYSSDPNELGYNEENFLNLEERIQDTLIFLAECRSKLEPSIATATRAFPSISLPHVTIPAFDGDYAQWQSFHDLFRQMIHEQQLGNAQKMWYLKSNLKGEAERLIRHLPITDENYDLAWTTLTNRYSNQRLRVATLLDRLTQQPMITSDSPSALKKLHDITKECLAGLKNFNINIASWDPILLHILLKKLDKVTHALYEQTLTSPRELQPVDAFLAFLERRFQSLEALCSDKKSTTQNKPTNRTSALISIKDSQSLQCKNCKGSHRIYTCEAFKQLSIWDRVAKIKQLRLCLNCLRGGHRSAQCSAGSCLKCGKKHNTLLHMDANNQDKTTPSITAIQTTANATKQGQVSSIVKDKGSTNVNHSIALSTEISASEGPFVLLATALIKVTNQKGKSIEMRALLDSRSQINIITEMAVRKLGLQPTSYHIHIRGLGGASQQSQQKVTLSLQSRITTFARKIDAIVLPHITSSQPSQGLNSRNWAIPGNIQLADPHFDREGHIDLLLGADIYYELLATGQMRLSRNLPLLQNTVFGWIIAGRVATSYQKEVTCGILNTDDSKLSEQIERFWKLEEPESTENFAMTTQEINCENHFGETMKRTNNGRFIVKLPFKVDPAKLGKSRGNAERRLFKLEWRLARNPELRKQYNKFMDEYKQLGHMTEIDEGSIPSLHYFLPHHSVLKPESTTTKLRAVFDASSETSSGYSLNDVLATGPTIQSELFTILVRFRLPCFVFTADIEKMYRQVQVSEEDKRFQLILWRNEPNEPIRCYQLNTVTYGTSSAPYLATKCLQELSSQTTHKYPSGSTALRRDFYMDDVMSGANTLTEAIETQHQLRTMLQSAGFKLRKWCANNKNLLNNIPVEDQALQLDITQEREENVKTLGLVWTPKTDEFQIRCPYTESKKVTKRSALSDIAHLFDPLGLMAPVTVTAKIFLQRLWSLKIGWDEEIPLELQAEWSRYYNDLQGLNQIKVPRHIFGGKVPEKIQLHVFSDASEKVYGAAVYLRAIQSDGVHTVRLLCAKSKVAPLKRVTLPRLELCAARLAAELAHRLKRDIEIPDYNCFYWTDSEIVLNWINAEASSFYTFVANRVAAIQQKSSPKQWRHIHSKENPADLVSRGVAPGKLQNYALWFYGPIFLHGSEECWPERFHSVDTTLEKKRSKMVLAMVKDSISISIKTLFNDCNA